MSEVLTISPKEYDSLRKLIYDRFGINLGEKKRSLVIGRLFKVLQQNNFKNFGEYHQSLLDDKSGSALTTLVDRISTNHTYFYRESAHFLYFKKQVLPRMEQLLQQKTTDQIHLWSAGCSSGEEPYTLSMLVSEYHRDNPRPLPIKILATDISSAVLEKAQRGIYSADNVSHLPRPLVSRYFQTLHTGEMEVTEELKKMILFRRLNLMRREFPFRKKFNIIFCRNVMIYFDLPTREGLLQKFYNSLEQEGYLFIGNSESLGRSHPYFKYIQPAVYQKVGK